MGVESGECTGSESWVSECMGNGTSQACKWFIRHIVYNERRMSSFFAPEKQKNAISKGSYDRRQLDTAALTLAIKSGCLMLSIRGEQVV